MSKDTDTSAKLISGQLDAKEALKTIAEGLVKSAKIDGIKAETAAWFKTGELREYYEPIKAQETKEQRRIRLIEQYVGEMLKPISLGNGCVGFPSVGESLVCAQEAADAVIKATEEK